MAAGAWVIHDQVEEDIHKVTLNLLTGTKKMRLYGSSQSALHASTATVASTYTQITNAGYTANGAAVTFSVTRSGSITTVTCTNGQWTATGSSMVAKYAAIVDEVADRILFSCDLDAGAGSVTALDTKIFLVQIATTGIYTINTA